MKRERGERGEKKAVGKKVEDSRTGADVETRPSIDCPMLDVFLLFFAF